MDVRVAVSVAATDGMRSGLGVYTYSLYEAMLRLGLVREVVAFGPQVDLACIRPLADRGDPVTLVPTAPANTSRGRNVLWHQLTWPRQLRRFAPDVVHFAVANRRVAWLRNWPTVGTVHDLAELHFPERYTKARAHFVRFGIVPGLGLLSRVLSISEATARDVRRLGPFAPPIDVVANGVDLKRFCPGDRTRARRRVAATLGFDGPFVFYPARLEHPIKNHVTLIRAFQRARERGDLPHRLVCVGADWNGAEVVRAAAAAAGEHVVFPGFVPHELLVELFRACEVMAFPSRFEGFGLPLLEAMASGAPVLTSSAASLTEVAGSAAIVLDPLDEAAWTEALLRLLTDKSERQRLSQAGLARAAEFTWERAARGTVASFQRAASASTGCAR